MAEQLVANDYNSALSIYFSQFFWLSATILRKHANSTALTAHGQSLTHKHTHEA